MFENHPPRSAGRGGEALPGKEKTAAKGEILTAVFLLIIGFHSISPSSLGRTLRLIGGPLFYYH
jgi:hypothetical protein